MAYPAEVLKKAREEYNQKKELFRSENNRLRSEIYSKVPKAQLIEKEIASTCMRLSSCILEGGDIEKNIEEIRRFNKQKIKELSLLLCENGFASNSLETKYFCPLCQDSGIYKGKTCSCVTDIRKKLMYERLGGFEDSSFPEFNSLQLSYYGEYQGLMENTLQKCFNYAKGFTLSSKSMLFFGGVGLGKTHVSKAIGKMVIDKGFDVFYIPFTTLAQKLENAKFGRSDDSFEDFLSPVLDCELLILDDVGAEFTTGFTVSLLYEIVNTRLIKNIPTIINTNLDDDDLREKYGERTASRLANCYSFMVFKGEDIRMKLKFSLK